MNDENLQQKPIFFDESQRRYGVLSVLAGIVTATTLLGAVAFLVSIALNPRLAGQTIGRRPADSAEHMAGRRPLREYQPDRSDLHPVDTTARVDASRERLVEDTSPQDMRYILRHDRGMQDAKRRLRAAIRQERELNAAATTTKSTGRTADVVRAVFYLNNEDKDSVDSLQHHIQDTTHLMPCWLQLTDNGKDLQITQELSGSGQTQGTVTGESYDDIAIRLAHEHGVAIVPVLQNAAEGSFPVSWVHNLVINPAAESRVINGALSFVLSNHYQGINVDLETDAAEDRAALTSFIDKVSTAFHQHGLLVTEDIQMDSDAYDLPALTRLNDFLIPMIYDEHADETRPGPIAAQGWFDSELAGFLQQVPASKTVLGIGNYAYDWVTNTTSAESLSFEQACQTAQESRDGDDGRIQIDPASLNPYFTYYDDSAGQGDKEIPHQVWLEDATTTYNQMLAARPFHLLGAALWRAGTEDPSIWTYFNRQGDAALTNATPARLADVTYNYFGTQFEGQGDVLDVVQQPTPGNRDIEIDGAKHFITGETFNSYPSQWVIRRQGMVNQDTGENDPKKIALTFDDGPDPRWTPQILDILQRYHVPATFFVVGENAEAHPGILAREWSSGMDIGNHSFTHPEMDNVSGLRTALELDATQRVIEAMTGHMTTLFRAPNRADSEPTSYQDFEPILDANHLGYLFIGEQIDPTDWNPGITADQIVKYVLANPDKGNCVLLHDAGGETRAQTVLALPRIIEGLRARGYSFVSVSQLIYPGLGRAEARAKAFPVIPQAQRLTVALDRAVFYSTYITGEVLAFLFVTAILLGVVRVVLMAILATLEARRERNRKFDPTYQPAVSVVIAAYNEAKVINRTIATLLASNYPNIDIFVVDDGSKDGTADAVRSVYGADPRVRVTSKPNGGKASALNLGIRECAGEIIVALDADTIFTPDTISRLVRHFHDPGVGAVSGNVKVGNRSNAWTIWQAVEYITSQNFDRRAYDLLNCITVVPGAVGAWRRDAIVLAGMYSSQTLAEDTDLTFKIRKLGYRIRTDNSALAYTEAPDNGRNFAKQRFRWAFGTLQCLWKHRDAMLNRRYGAFGMVAMPSLWIFQICFQAIAPIVDLGILWTWFYGHFIMPTSDHHAVLTLLGYWALFTTVELIGAVIAFRLDDEDLRLVLWLPLQRFAYRQFMYYVVLKSIRYALVGKRVGWGKFERKGTVQSVHADPVVIPMIVTDESLDRAK